MSQVGQVWWLRWKLQWLGLWIQRTTGDRAIYQSLFSFYPTIIRTLSHLPCSRISVSDLERNGRRKQNWPHVVQFFSNYQKEQPLISWLVHSLLILQRKDVSFITEDKHNPSITDWMAQVLVNTDLPIKFPFKNKSTALTRINPCANIHVSLPYD